MRQLTDHVANPANDRITINVVDEPGAGGANHVYSIVPTADASNEIHITTIAFQNGPIAEVGVNGITQEVLLAIVIDRLRSFQAGPFACAENAEALRWTEGALEALKARTRERMARGVEGKNEV